MPSLTLPAVIAAGAIDSVNPCAIGVMVFLATYLAAVGSKKRLLKVGFIYIFTVFITYYLAGLGLLAFMNSFSSITYWVHMAAAIILLLAGLINVKELFWYKKGISLAIPESKKPLIEKYIHKTSLPAAIILGFLVSAFELPCSGQVYLGILSMLASAQLKILGYMWLGIYNFIFVLPLLVILFLIYFDKKSNWFSNLNENKKKWLRFFMGLAMLTLGILMLLGII